MATSITRHFQFGCRASRAECQRALLQQQRYYPFGEVRDLPNDGLAKISATDFGYTGQRALDAQGNSFGLGLMDYKARFYDAYITHFSQPDSIIPDPSNPQSLNRYSYVLNNPIRYNDPTGHRFTDNTTDPEEKNILKQTYRQLTGLSACDEYPSSDLRSNDPHQSCLDAFGKKPDKVDPIDLADYEWGRTLYWESRLGGCGLSIACEQKAKDLMNYYDFGKSWDVTEFHSTVNEDYVLADAIGIPLGFIGLGGSTFGLSKNGLKVIQTLGIVDGISSGIGSAYNGDKLGLWLGFLSAAPVVGGFVSVVALGRDLGAGYYETHPYVPSMHRY